MHAHISPTNMHAHISLSHPHLHLTHSLTPPHTQSHTHTLTHTPTHSHIHSLTLTHSLNSPHSNFFPTQHVIVIGIWEMLLPMEPFKERFKRQLLENGLVLVEDIYSLSQKLRH